MLLVVVVLSFIAPPILPNMYSIPVHLIKAPLSFVGSAITPNIVSISVYIVILPGSSVVAAIRPDIGALPVFLPQLILPLIATPVWPGFDSLSTLKIVDPIALINGSISMIVYPESLCLTIHPLPLEVILVWILKFPPPALQIGLPFSLVLAPIRIGLQSLSLPLPTDPFPAVSAAGAEGDSGQPLLELLLHLCLDEFVECVILLAARLSLNRSPR